MDEKRKQGYISAVICSLISVILLTFSLKNEFNLSGQMLWILTFFFGVLGLGSFWKPNTIGEIASEILKNMSKNGVETNSDSHNKQVQIQSPHGVQAMASQGGNVTINVDSGKKEQEEYSMEIEKEIIYKDTIVVEKNGVYYDHKFIRGEHLVGEISSNSAIDIYFVDEVNFDKWNRDKSFKYEECRENVLDTYFDFLIPKKGMWYVLIENSDDDTIVTVKVLLYTYISL